MGLAPGHLLGQLIGNILEDAIKPVLQEMADRHNLYLDSKGLRPLVRDGVKVNWTDDLGNSHDLDFVLERGGTFEKAGNPAAFVEAAWRRYTKHSKAKAQEIQGAVLPVIAKWANVKPAGGAVIAGEWTRPSIAQLRSSGFEVLALDFNSTVAIFKRHGVDIEGTKDGTPDEFWQRQVDVLGLLGLDGRQRLVDDLRTTNEEQFKTFVSALEKRVIRTVERIVVMPLHGTTLEFDNLNEAVASLETYPCSKQIAPFIRFEIRVVYTNGDRIEASFGAAHDAVEFLNTFR